MLEIYIESSFCGGNDNQAAHRQLGFEFVGAAI